MIDWLYGELDPDQAREVSSHLEGCARCQSEASAFERTRELLRDVPEVEPPGALSAMLIREAAARAPGAEPAGSRESGGGFGGWLSAFFRPLMHPAAAAVASLVLVVGVAGTLYLTGDDGFVESEVASTADRPATPATDEPFAGAPAPDEPAATAALEKTPLAEPKSEPDPETADLPGGAEGDGRRADLLAKDRDESLRAKTATRRTRVVDRSNRKPSKKKARPRAPQKSVEANAISGADMAPGPFAGESKGASKSDGVNQGYRAYRDRPQTGLDNWAQSQQLELTRAYRDDDCLRAAKIANDILDRHPDFYTAQTQRLEAVKRCKPYVSKEQSRRKTARSQSQPASKTTSGKASRARQADEAAAEPAN
jgi:hypothetical protein